MVTSGEGEGGSEIRVGDKEVQATMLKINKLQGYIVQHTEYSQYFIMLLLLLLSQFSRV